VSLRTAAVAPLLALLLAACASLSPPTGDWLSGRLSVRVEGAAPKSVSAAFDLRGDSTTGQLDLTTPLGTTIAQARWSPGEVRLITSDGETHFDDLNTLSREVLGESVPMAALFDWLRGRPWPQAPSQPIAGGGFEQLGWEIDLARYAEGWVSARRIAEPPVTVRARLDKTG
jgi:outer membrane lipoprotein LolB